MDPATLATDTGTATGHGSTAALEAASGAWDAGDHHSWRGAVI